MFSFPKVPNFAEIGNRPNPSNLPKKLTYWEKLWKPTLIAPVLRANVAKIGDSADEWGPL